MHSLEGRSPPLNFTTLGFKTTELGKKNRCKAKRVAVVLPSITTAVCWRLKKMLQASFNSIYITLVPGVVIVVVAVVGVGDLLP